MDAASDIRTSLGERQWPSVEIARQVDEIREQVAKQHEAMRQVGDEASAPGATVEEIAAPSGHERQLERPRTRRDGCGLSRRDRRRDDGN